MAGGTARTAYSGTLDGSAADTVRFTDDEGNPVRYSYVTIANGGTGPLYATADGTAPTAGGANCHVVEAGQTALLPNGAPVWYQSSRAIAAGGDNAAQQSRAGQAPNPGTTVTIVAAAEAAYTVAAAG